MLATQEMKQVEADMDILYGPRKDVDMADVLTTLPEKNNRETAKVERNGLAPSAERDTSYDRPNIRAVVSMELRMSAIRQCLRRLAYEVQEIEPSDEVPARNRALMEMGKRLEPLVKELMREDGWEITDEGFVELPHGRVILTGHPDGVATHPVLTDGRPAIAEIKTRSVSAANYAWDAGVERTHPEAVEQASLYSMALQGEVQAVVVVTMARDSGEYRAERIPAERVEEAYKTAMQRVDEISQMVRQGGIPEPELPQGHFKCQSCPFRTLCGNAEVPPKTGETGLSGDELNEQIQIWVESNASAPKSSSPAVKAKTAASNALKAHMIATEDFELEVDVEGVTYVLKRSESSKLDIDLKAFNELVPPQIREQVVIENSSNRLNIRPKRRVA